MQIRSCSALEETADWGPIFEAWHGIRSNTGYFKRVDGPMTGMPNVLHYRTAGNERNPDTCPQIRKKCAHPLRDWMAGQWNDGHQPRYNRRRNRSGNRSLLACPESASPGILNELQRGHLNQVAQITPGNFDRSNPTTVVYPQDPQGLRKAQGECEPPNLSLGRSDMSMSTHAHEQTNMK